MHCRIQHHDSLFLVNKKVGAPFENGVSIHMLVCSPLHHL